MNRILGFYATNRTFRIAVYAIVTMLLGLEAFRFGSNLGEFLYCIIN